MSTRHTHRIGRGATWRLFGILTIVAGALLFSHSAFAIDLTYKPLVGVPGVSSVEGGQGLADYFNKLYLIAIGIGALIAFIKITMAGAKWSMSGVVTDKSEARRDIQGVILGLIILLSPALILGTINPDLLDLSIFKSATPVQLKTIPGSGTAPVIGGGTVDTSTEFQMGQCNATSGSKWDHLCNTCILSTQVFGQTCGKTESSSSVTTSCSSFYNLSSTSACKDFCEKTLKGTFSNNACTYGGTTN